MTAHNTKRSVAWLPVILVFLGSTVLALGLLWAWSRAVVDPWAAHAGRREGDKPATGEVRDYSVPGTYGDAFAPIVGVLTALALGANVASAYMQREEMREAREQFTAQAAALAEANELAHEANELEIGAQMIAVLQQIGDLDRQGIEKIKGFEALDPGAAWAKVVSDEEQKLKREGARANLEIHPILKRRAALADMMAGLDMRMAAKQDALRKRHGIPPKP